jgi:hypothetical protein
MLQGVYLFVCKWITYVWVLSWFLLKFYKICIDFHYQICCYHFLHLKCHTRNCVFKYSWDLPHYMVVWWHVFCWELVVILDFEWNNIQIWGSTISCWHNAKTIDGLNNFKCQKTHLWTFTTRNQKKITGIFSKKNLLYRFFAPCPIWPKCHFD